MSEMYLSHTKPWSRMQILSESRRGSKVTKPIFSNSIKRYCKMIIWSATQLMRNSFKKSLHHRQHLVALSRSFLIFVLIQQMAIVWVLDSVQYHRKLTVSFLLYEIYLEVVMTLMGHVIYSLFENKKEFEYEIIGYLFKIFRPEEQILSNELFFNSLFSAAVLKETTLILRCLQEDC